MRKILVMTVLLKKEKEISESKLINGKYVKASMTY